MAGSFRRRAVFTITTIREDKKATNAKRMVDARDVGYLDDEGFSILTEPQEIQLIFIFQAG